MGSTAIIQTNNLSKTYKSRKEETLALNQLSLQVQPGEIFGYLGPNGAGKTTTIRLLLDLIRPTNGSASIFGLDAQSNSVEVHHRIGFLPGELSLWKNRSAKQIIHYLASVRGNVAEITKEAAVLADRLKFDMTKKMRDYSTGNKRKLGLVIAMMHQPELLILDEPSSGLDPLMQQTFHQMMMEYREAGKTVFLSSHTLSEVQEICDRAGILRDGKLRAVEDIEKLTNVEFRYVTMKFQEDVPQDWAAQLNNMDGVSNVKIDNSELKLRLVGDFDPMMRVVSGGYIKDIRVQEPSLEEIFLTFYGNNNS